MLNSKAYIKLKKYNEKHRLTNKISSINRIITGKDTKKEAVIQDVGIPIQNCVKFLQFFNSEIKIKPVWICPMKIYNNKHNFPLFEIDSKILYIDFGFWDSVETKKENGYYNKMIENTVEKLKGKKSLYSDSYFQKDDFFRIYNGKIYEKLKRKYDSGGVFLDLYQKTVLRK